MMTILVGSGTGASDIVLGPFSYRQRDKKTTITLSASSPLSRRRASARRLPSCLGSRPVSSLLQPVGPDSAQTYWARRAGVRRSIGLPSLAPDHPWHEPRIGSPTIRAQASTPSVHRQTSMAPAKFRSDTQSQGLNSVRARERIRELSGGRKSVKSTPLLAPEAL
jgi:hypothetical protein